MKSLIKKDIYLIFVNAKSFLLMFALFAIVFLTNKETAAYFAAMVAVMSMTLTISTCSFDDNSNWNRFALTMPVRKKDIVTAKYFSLLIFTVLGIAFSFVLALIGSMIFDIDIMAILAASIVSALVSTMMGTILLPIIYKFGTEKARLSMMIIFLVFFMATFTMGKMGVIDSSKLSEISASPQMIAIIAAILAAIMFFISMKISQAIFIKKYR